MPLSEQPPRLDLPTGKRAQQLQLLRLMYKSAEEQTPVQLLKDEDWFFAQYSLFILDELVVRGYISDDAAQEYMRTYDVKKEDFHAELFHLAFRRIENFAFTGRSVVKEGETLVVHKLPALETGIVVPMPDALETYARE